MEKDVQNKTEDKDWIRKGVFLYIKLTTYIVGSALFAVFVGKWLDSLFGTSPWMFVISLFVSFVVVMVLIVREGNKQLTVKSEQLTDD